MHATGSITHSPRRCARRLEDSPFYRELVAYSRPSPQDAIGRDYHVEGRIDPARIAEMMPEPPSAAYLCGPPSFLADARAALEGLGIAPEHIHWESF